MKNTSVLIKVCKFMPGIIVIVASSYIPCIEGLTRQGMQYMGVLIAMIFYLLVNLTDEYVIVLFALAVCVVLKLNDFKGVFVAYADTTVWLLVGVLLLGCAVTQSGLMERVSVKIINLFPKTFNCQMLALQIVGIILNPLIPSTTAKASIVAPLAQGVGKKLEIKNKSREMTGLFLSAFIIPVAAGQIFYSGSINIFTFLAMFSYEDGNDFDWIKWIRATWVWGVLITIMLFVALRVLYGSQKEKFEQDFSCKIMKNPMSDKEKKVLFILVATLLLWITKGIHGVSEAVISLFVILTLSVTSCVDKKDLRCGVAWDMIIYIGGVMSMATLMTKVGINEWLSSVLSPIIEPILINEYVYIISLSIIVLVCRYFIMSLTSTISLLFIAFSQVAMDAGISPFVTGYVIVSMAQVWTTRYNNPMFLTALALIEEDSVDVKRLNRASYLYAVIAIIGFLICIPWWKHIGMIK